MTGNESDSVCERKATSESERGTVEPSRVRGRTRKSDERVGETSTSEGRDNEYKEEAEAASERLRR